MRDVESKCTPMYHNAALSSEECALMATHAHVVTAQVARLAVRAQGEAAQVAALTTQGEIMSRQVEGAKAVSAQGTTFFGEFRIAGTRIMAVLPSQLNLASSASMEQWL